MAGNSYSISKREIKRALIAYGVREPEIEALVADAEKRHMHMNVIAFVLLLEKVNLTRNRIIQIMRRIGLDDIKISKVLDMVDEEKMLAQAGHIYKARIEV
jgi:hypothetical protein